MKDAKINYPGLLHASLIVENTPRSLEFYCGILQLARLTSRPDLGYPGAWLSATCNR